MSHRAFSRAVRTANPAQYTNIVQKASKQEGNICQPLDTDNDKLQPTMSTEIVADLHGRVMEWDRDLPIMPPPPLSSLVDFLVRRKCGSRDSKLKTSFTRSVVKIATRLLGLERAQTRLLEGHKSDPVDNCWYCPGNHGDTFGIRPDEVYFHEAIIPSQPVTSYAVLIRGSPLYPSSAVSDGISRHNTPDERSGLDEEPVFGSKDVMVNRAASLLLSLLEARRFYSNADFKQERFRDKALSMQWYRHIFSTSMQFHPGCIERYTTPPAELPRHIVVMVNGGMYKVVVLAENEQGKEAPVSHGHLVEQFKAILEDAQRHQSHVPVAMLTTLPPSDRWREEQRLKNLSPRNHSNLSIIRDSLFTVCLDPDEGPSRANEAMYALYSKNCANRWYDKSVQLVVFGNGVAGFVNNYLAAMTGTVATNFVGDAVRNELMFSGDAASQHRMNNEQGACFTRLSWDDTHDGYLARRVASIRATSHTAGPFKPPSKDVFTVSLGYDFERFCQTMKISPGGAFQAALQVALARMRDSGAPPRVTEVVSLRHLRFGGMTFMDGSLADMREFVQQTIKLSNTHKQRESAGHQPAYTRDEHNHLRQLLLQATQEYKESVVSYKKGRVHLWHLDALYRCLQLPNRLPNWGPPVSGFGHNYRSALLTLLRKPLLNLLPAQVPENVTSNPLWVPEIEAIGRPGVKCILPPKCMALHYVFGGKAISITANANTGHPCHGREEEFIEHLREGLALVKALIADS